MAKGICISIGLNSVDPLQYSGWAGQLNACEADANDLAAIAQQRGFETRKFLTSSATALSVLSALSDAANALETGDILVLGYSGHGAQVDDIHAEEDDAQDETWVLFDRMLIDDELYAMWSQFKAGVRIFVLSDSCHSGSVIKDQFYSDLLAIKALSKSDADLAKVKAMPTKQAALVYKENRTRYDELQYLVGSSTKANVAASVILISACQDNQLANDGGGNSVFTGIWKRTYADGNFNGSYSQFHKAIMDKSPATQSPNYFLTGTANLEFEAQRPFTI